MYIAPLGELIDRAELNNYIFFTDLKRRMNAVAGTFETGFTDI